jgi:hypothetical protein
MFIISFHFQQQNSEVPVVVCSSSSLYGAGSPSQFEVKTTVCVGEEATAASSSSSNVTTTPLLKGVLWQQREKRFSRWKERFFILTTDYLQCFRRGTSKISEMGAFIYRIRLCEVKTTIPMQ